MTERKIEHEIMSRQANLWEWQGRNPYREHPLLVLGLKKSKVTVQAINDAARFLMDKQRLDGDTTKCHKSHLVLKSKDLLMNPATRVVCELMRIPPVEVPADEFNELKKLGGEMFKSLEELPLPPLIECKYKVFCDVLLKHIAGQEPTISEVGAPSFGPDPHVPRPEYSGISFSQRKRVGR